MIAALFLCGESHRLLPTLAALGKDVIQGTQWQLPGQMTAMQIDHRAFDVPVAHELLHGDNVHPILQKVGGIRVPQGMGVHVLSDACLPRYCFDGPLHAALAVAGIKAFSFRITGALKQKGLWLLCQDVSADTSYQVFR